MEEGKRKHKWFDKDFKLSAVKMITEGGIPGKVKKYKQKIPAMVVFQSATSLAPTVGGEVIKSLSDEEMREIQQQQVDYSITVKAGTGIIIYNSERVEYQGF